MQASVITRLRGLEKRGSRPAPLAYLGTSATACGATTLPCGLFTFTGNPLGYPTEVGIFGIDATVGFAFKPAMCGAECTCNTVAFVQIVRFRDLATGKPFTPDDHPEAKGRMVTGQPDATRNGWWVDVLPGKVLGYYGSNNPTSPAGPIAFDSDLLNTGSNTRRATLTDHPRARPNTLFEAVSVPVCIDPAAACHRRALGYHYWQFSVDGAGKVDGPLDEAGVTWMQTAFALALAKWDIAAIDLGKRQLGNMPPLP